MSDLATRIRDYYDGAADPVDAAEVFARLEVELRPARRHFRPVWVAVAAGIFVFVAVGAAGLLGLFGGGGEIVEPTPVTTAPAPTVTTADGWTRRTHPETLGEAWISPFGTVLFGERIIAAGGVAEAGIGGGIWLSDDSGDSWRAADMGPGAEVTRVQGVTVGGPGLVATGVYMGDVEASGVVWTSSDGEVWEMITDEIFGEAMGGVAAGPERIVAVGRESITNVGFNAAIFTSEDGLVWDRVPHNDDLFGAWVPWDVTWTGRDFVAVGIVSWDLDHVPDQFAVWRSPDGLIWDRENVETGEARATASGSSVAGDAATTVVAIRVGGVWTSDNSGWEFNTLQDLETNSDCLGHRVRDVASFRGGFIAVGERCDGRAGVWEFQDGQWSVISDFNDMFDGVMETVQPIGAGQVLVFGNTRDGQAVVWTWTSGQ